MCFSRMFCSLLQLLISCIGLGDRRHSKKRLAKTEARDYLVIVRRDICVLTDKEYKQWNASRSIKLSTR